MSKRDLAKSFEKFCPSCLHFQEKTGVCKKFYFNVRDYQNKFIKKCNGKYFEKDKEKAEQENLEIEETTSNISYEKTHSKSMSEENSNYELVTVFEPQSEYEHLTAISLLEDAGIRYFAKNANVQNLFGAGQIGMGFNLAVGTIKIQVSKEDFLRAEEVLFQESLLDGQVEYESMDVCPACESPSNGEAICPECGLTLKPMAISEGANEADPDTAQKNKKALALKSLVYACLWLFGIGSILGLYYGLKSLRVKDSTNVTIKTNYISIAGITFSIIGLLISILNFFFTEY